MKIEQIDSDKRLSRKRIIFLSAKNPFDKGEWSGIPFFMFKSLSEYYEIEYMAGPSLAYMKLFGYYLSKICNLFLNKKYLFDYGLVISFMYGIYYTLKLGNRKDVNFIFCPAGLSELAFIKTRIPIVSAGDCSTVQMINYYPALQNVFRLSQMEIEFVERKALQKVSFQFLSSAWATLFVSDHYKNNTAKVVPFGANLENIPDEQRIIKKRLGDPVKLLFVGVDWYRKGGDIVLIIHNELIKRGTNSHLTIIGAKPPAEIQIPENVTVIEHIRKDTPEGIDAYYSFLAETHFMILPTRADCTPIVIAEAFAFGVPVLANNTGGLGSMIDNGNNGFLFNEINPELYVRKILDIINGQHDYSRLVVSCRESYTTKFNWNLWAKSLVETISF